MSTLTLATQSRDLSQPYLLGASCSIKPWRKSHPSYFLATNLTSLSPLVFRPLYVMPAFKSSVQWSRSNSLMLDSHFSFISLSARLSSALVSLVIFVEEICFVNCRFHSSQTFPVRCEISHLLHFGRLIRRVFGGLLETATALG